MLHIYMYCINSLIYVACFKLINLNNTPLLWALTSMTFQTFHTVKLGSTNCWFKRRFQELSEKQVFSRPEIFKILNKEACLFNGWSEECVCLCERQRERDRQRVYVSVGWSSLCGCVRLSLSEAAGPTLLKWSPMTCQMRDHCSLMRFML